jgi:hypothetical protein
MPVAQQRQARAICPDVAVEVAALPRRLPEAMEGTEQMPAAAEAAAMEHQPVLAAPVETALRL